MITVNPEKAKAIHNARQKQLRADAFTLEHDPLAMKVLRGEATPEELIAKAEEIRTRYPYIE